MRGGPEMIELQEEILRKLVRDKCDWRRNNLLLLRVVTSEVKEKVRKFPPRHPHVYVSVSRRDSSSSSLSSAITTERRDPASGSCFSSLTRYEAHDHASSFKELTTKFGRYREKGRVTIHEHETEKLRSWEAVTKFHWVNHSFRSLSVF